MEKPTINRNAFEPAYSQLINILLDQISRGEYRPGDRLPSEFQLCKRYKVSPMTVRRAINGLIEQGVVSTAQDYLRRGRFVLPKHPQVMAPAALFRSSRFAEFFALCLLQGSPFYGCS